MAAALMAALVVAWVLAPLAAVARRSEGRRLPSGANGEWHASPPAGDGSMLATSFSFQERVHAVNTPSWLAGAGAAILCWSWRAPPGRAEEGAVSRPPLLSSLGHSCTWQHRGRHHCPSADSL